MPNALCYVYFFKETSVLATTQVVELVKIIATRTIEECDNQTQILVEHITNHIWLSVSKLLNEYNNT